MEAPEATRDIIRCCSESLGGGTHAGVDGNVSVPRGVLKSELSREDLVEVDLAGRRLEGCREATTELDCDVLPEIALLMGEVPCVPYATTGTPP